jgi:putative Mn2+ efflux pump MntP
MHPAAIFSEVITLFIMAFALGMDAFSVGLGMGMARLRLKRIFKIGVMIGMFHIAMPLLGMIIGHYLTDLFGTVAVMVGGVLLLLLGAQMIYTSFGTKEELLVAPVGFGLLLFSISVSLDSFSVGLSLGIYGARMWLTLFLFGAVSMILTWSGLLMGRKFQHFLGTYSEALGGCILFVFGLKLLL